MSHVLDFIRDYQSVITIILLNLFFVYLNSMVRSVKRTLDLIRIKQEASIYASMKVNGNYKEYSDEWHRHYNARLDYLIKEYKFTIN